MERKKIIIAIGLVVAAIFFIFLFGEFIFSNFISTSFNFITTVKIRDIPIKAEVVRSKEKIEKGLSGREKLEWGRGMLFVMPESDFQRFWMKGMRFGIDIIWIENGRVTGIERNISAKDDRIFTSPSPASYVLEVPEGFCDQNKIKVSDPVEIKI